MNENINLCEILKDCPKGTKFWSPLAGVVIFNGIDKDEISVILNDNKIWYIDSDGTQSFGYIANTPITSKEIMLYPSKDQRDWSKWQCPKPKFDPKTLQPFDRVLARIGGGDAYCWFADFVSMPALEGDTIVCVIGDRDASMIIPYNDETKHLVRTSDEAPEFYRYWED